MNKTPVLSHTQFPTSNAWLIKQHEVEQADESRFIDLDDLICIKIVETS